MFRSSASASLLLHTRQLEQGPAYCKLVVSWDRTLPLHIHAPPLSCIRMFRGITARHNTHALPFITMHLCMPAYLHFTLLSMPVSPPALRPVAFACHHNDVKVMWMKEGVENAWREVGRTEVVGNNLNPSFVTLIPVVSIGCAAQRDYLTSICIPASFRPTAESL